MVGNQKLWGGRFEAQVAEWVEAFGASIGFDQKMAKQDLEGSIAHVTMLGETGIISHEESFTIKTGLMDLLSELEAGTLNFDISNEDIHMNMESLLTQKIGPVAGKLHTARSRNDQVATDMHLYLKEQSHTIVSLLKDLRQVLVALAEEHVETIMPGYTHLQHAQPISFGHHLMAYYQMFTRDSEWFTFNLQHTDVSPLGAVALAGTTFPIDRYMTSDLLGFSAPYANSLDAVSNRDFILEFLSNCSILMMPLSRFCEEIINWCSHEYQFVTLSDTFSTGSSIMPQKKNPDMAELIRGKTGRVYGDLLGLLTVNKDLMETSTTKDFSNATELADYLAAKGLPFREAHAIVGHMVLECTKKGIYLQDVPLEDYKVQSDLIEADVYEVLDSHQAVARRQSLGGTGFNQVLWQIEKAKTDLLS